MGAMPAGHCPPLGELQGKYRSFWGRIKDQIGRARLVEHRGFELAKSGEHHPDRVRAGTNLSHARESKENGQRVRFAGSIDRGG
jgi:hypothetical protein